MSETQDLNVVKGTENKNFPKEDFCKDLKEIEQTENSSMRKEN